MALLATKVPDSCLSTMISIGLIYKIMSSTNCTRRAFNRRRLPVIYHWLLLPKLPSTFDLK